MAPVHIGYPHFANPSIVIRNIKTIEKSAGAISVLRPAADLANDKPTLVPERSVVGNEMLTVH